MCCCGGGASVGESPRNADALITLMSPAFDLRKLAIVLPRLLILQRQVLNLSEDCQTFEVRVQK